MLSRLLPSLLLVSSAPEAQGRGTMSIVGVTVVDDAGVRAGRTVRVRDGRIVAIAPGTTRLPGPSIDGAGKFLIPGLWDVHVHQALRIWKGLPIDSSASYFHPLFLAHGVTSVRDMGGDLATLVRWRQRAESGRSLGPRQLVTGEKLGQYPVVPGTPFPLRTPDDVRRSIAALADGGADFVKVTEIPAALVGVAAQAARERGLPLDGHVTAAVSLRGAVAQRFRTVEHLDDVLFSATPREDALRRRVLQEGRRPPVWERVWRRLTGPPPEPEFEAARTHDASRLAVLASTLRSAGTTVVPTLRLAGVRLRIAHPALRMPPDALEIRLPPEPVQGYAAAPVPSGSPNAVVWDRLCSSVGTLHRAGVPILPGTDAPSLFAVPGASLHDELELLAACGLTSAEVLRAATSGAAALAGRVSDVGRIQVGYQADLVLLEADPLADIRNTRRIAGVMRGGHWFDRRGLDSLMAVATQVVADRRPLFPPR